MEPMSGTFETVRKNRCPIPFIWETKNESVCRASNVAAHSTHVAGGTQPGSSERVWPTYFSSVCILIIMDVGTSTFVWSAQLSWECGGIALFMPRLIIGILCIIPVHFLETIVGQYTSKSYGVAVSRMGPGFGGVALAILIMGALTSVTYMDSAVWYLAYAHSAIVSSAPLWETCNVGINSRYCYSEQLDSRCNGSIFFNFTCVSVADYCSAHDHQTTNGTHCLRGPEGNGSSLIHKMRVRKMSRLDFYDSFYRASNKHLMSPEALHHRRMTFVVGTGCVWLLAILPTLNLWVLSYVAVVLAVVSPIVTLLILFRVVLNPGATAGLNRFLWPEDYSALRSPSCWNKAAFVMLYSIDVGKGVIPTIRSRSCLTHKTFTTSVIIVVWNLTYAFLNVMMFYAVRGTLEQESEAMRRELYLLKDDPGAQTFVAYTSLLQSMPYPELWGVLYFSMIMLNTVASITVIVVVLGFHLSDAVPYFNRRPFHCSVLVLVTPMLLFAACRCIAMVQGIEGSSFFSSDSQWVIGIVLSTLWMSWKMKDPEVLSDVWGKLNIRLNDASRQWILFMWLVPAPVILLVCSVLTVSDVQLPKLKNWLDVLFLVLECLPLVAALAYSAWLWKSGLRGKKLFITSAKFGPDPRALLEVQPQRMVTSASVLSLRARPGNVGISTPRSSDAKVPPPARVIF